MAAKEKVPNENLMKAKNYFSEKENEYLDKISTASMMRDAEIITVEQCEKAHDYFKDIANRYAEKAKCIDKIILYRLEQSHKYCLPIMRPIQIDEKIIETAENAYKEYMDEITACQ